MQHQVPRATQRPHGRDHHQSVTTAHKWLNIDDRTLGRYNHLDCYATALLARKHKDFLAKHGNLEFYQREVAPLVPAAIAMGRVGIPINLAAKRKYSRALHSKLAECDEVCREFADQAGLHHTDKFPNSDKQVGALLYDKLGFRCRKHTPTGGRSVDQEALGRLLKHLLKRERDYVPLLHALLHRSRLQTIKERYLDFSVDPDGRLRPTVKMFGTKSLRYAYSDPPVQQWVKELRHIVQAPEGYTIVGADYEQIEARILAYLSGDEADIEAFERGWDVHSIMTAEAFGYDHKPWPDMEPRDWREFKERYEGPRVACKTIRYGQAYGGSADTMKVKTFCPCERWGCAAKNPTTPTREAAERAQIYWQHAHRRVLDWQDELIRETRRRNHYTSPFGFRRYFWKPWGGEAERELLNFPIQHTAATIINRAQRRLHAVGAPVFMQMHDYLGLLVPANESDLWAEQLEKTMTEPVPELGGVNFPVDLTVSTSWA